jgi:uncharacterized protein (DUF2267 family)
MKDGLTKDNFTNKQYLSKVLKAAGVKDGHANRVLLKEVLAKLSPTLAAAPAAALAAN